MKKTILFFACIQLLLCSCTDTNKSIISSDAGVKKQAYFESNYFDPLESNRTVAEWEPALGTLVTWPLCVPHTLVIELAKDNHLYTLVENQASKITAEKWFSTWGIDSMDVTFIYAPQGDDAWWTRDWGPHGVFTSKGELQLGDPKYKYATPCANLECNDSLFYCGSNKFLNIDTPESIPIVTQIDDDATVLIGDKLKLPVLDLPFVSTGGNFLTDGLGTGFSTCVITSENKILGNSPEKFFKLNDSLLGIKKYNIISNFEYPYGIQHIDCYMKLIDEETILVAEPPVEHPSYKIYEDIVKNELSQLKTYYNRPYKIRRIKIGMSKTGLAAYTNSIILNKTVYVPLFDIDLDIDAIKTWENIMPGYTVKGFKFSFDNEPIISKKMKRSYGEYGWNSGDALHCRTRAIWDSNMLFISVKKIDEEIKINNKAMIYISVIDYGGEGLVENQPRLYWRIKGSNSWNSSSLQNTKNKHHFYGSIEAQSKKTNIEYYIEAKSKSGKIERRPSTAPNGYYSYSYIE